MATVAVASTLTSVKMALQSTEDARTCVLTRKDLTRARVNEDIKLAKTAKCATESKWKSSTAAALIMEVWDIVFIRMFI